MARTPAAITVAGMIPQDPRQAPGLLLPPRQHHELQSALRQAPRPSLAVRRVREGLQQGRPLTRIIEDLRQQNAWAALRPYAAHPPQQEGLHPVPDASRERLRNSPQAKPAPGGPRFG